MYEIDPITSQDFFDSTNQDGEGVITQRSSFSEGGSLPSSLPCAQRVPSPPRSPSQEIMAPPIGYFVSKGKLKGIRNPHVPLFTGLIRTPENATPDQFYTNLKTNIFDESSSIAGVKNLESFKTCCSGFLKYLPEDAKTSAHELGKETFMRLENNSPWDEDELLDWIQKAKNLVSSSTKPASSENVEKTKFTIRYGPSGIELDVTMGGSNVPGTVSDTGKIIVPFLMEECKSLKDKLNKTEEQLNSTTRDLFDERTKRMKLEVEAQSKDEEIKLIDKIENIKSGIMDGIETLSTKVSTSISTLAAVPRKSFIHGTWGLHIAQLPNKITIFSKNKISECLETSAALSEDLNYLQKENILSIKVLPSPILRNLMNKLTSSSVDSDMSVIFFLQYDEYNSSGEDVAEDMEADQIVYLITTLISRISLDLAKFIVCSMPGPKLAGGIPLKVESKLKNKSVLVVPLNTNPPEEKFDPTMLSLGRALDMLPPNPSWGLEALCNVCSLYCSSEQCLTIKKKPEDKKPPKYETKPKSEKRAKAGRNDPEEVCTICGRRLSQHKESKFCGTPPPNRACKLCKDPNHFTGAHAVTDREAKDAMRKQWGAGFYFVSTGY